MAVDWPASLPQKVLKDGFSYTTQSAIIRSETDAGYPLIRRRFTAVTKTMSITMVFTPEEFEIFETFFTNSQSNPTLPGVSHGAVRVNFPDQMWFPGVGETEEDRPKKESRFVAESGGNPYNVVPDGETRDWRVTFTLEVLPNA